MGGKKIATSPLLRMFWLLIRSASSQMVLCILHKPCTGNVDTMIASCRSKCVLVFFVNSALFLPSMGTQRIFICRDSAIYKFSCRKKINRKNQAEQGTNLVEHPRARFACTTWPGDFNSIQLWYYMLVYYTIQY